LDEDQSGDVILTSKLVSEAQSSDGNDSQQRSTTRGLNKADGPGQVIRTLISSTVGILSGGQKREGVMEDTEAERE